MKLRFAPSPTGYLHLGNTRTLLINYLLAQKLDASFTLRLDDTDKIRCKPEFEHQIINDLEWLNINYDSVVKQSDRSTLYNDSIAHLKASGHLYRCFETKEELDFKRKRQLSQGKPPLYDRSALHLSPDQIEQLMAQGKKSHWRFKINPNETSWQDLSHGTMSFTGINLSDPVVIREDGTPLFTLAGIIDDIEMGITHIVRGDDHITNTAIQLQIAFALGVDSQRFTFAHVPLLTDASGAGLSKRLGSLSLKDLKQEGYEPFAVVNYLSTIGLGEKPHHTTHFLPIVQQMDLARLGKSSPKFSLDDLKRTNADILHHLDFDQVTYSCPSLTQEFWQDVQGNLEFIEDIKVPLTICYGEIVPKIIDQDYMIQAQVCLPHEPWTHETWGHWTQQLSSITGLKGKALYMPLRLALTAQEHGPEMKKLLPYIGYEKVMARLKGITI